MLGVGSRVELAGIYEASSEWLDYGGLSRSLQSRLWRKIYEAFYIPALI